MKTTKPIPKANRPHNFKVLTKLRKPKPEKCYLVQLFERNGEYEYYNTMRFKTSRNPQTVLKSIARTWYGSKPDKEGDGYYFNCGEIYVEPAGVQEISEATFKELGTNAMITSMSADA